MVTTSAPLLFSISEPNFTRSSPLLYKARTRKVETMALFKMIVLVYKPMICAVVVWHFFMYHRFVHQKQVKKSIEMKSYSIMRENGCSPRGIHIAPLLSSSIDHDRTSVTVSFFIERNCCLQADAIAPVVYYGQLQKLDAIHVVRGPVQPIQNQYNNTYETSNMVHYIDTYIIFHIPISDLEAGEKLYWYYIRILSEKELETTLLSYIVEDHSNRFWTPPLPSSPTKIAVVGDIGMTTNSQRTLRSILKSSQEEQLSHVIMLGDISYASGIFSKWIEWFDFADELLLSSILTTTVAGNHELECDKQNGHVFIPYEKFFWNPNRIADAVIPAVYPIEHCTKSTYRVVNYLYGNSFYAYQYGMVHIIVLNSYVYCTARSEQYEWLRQELSTRVDRSVTPWLIVAIHAPFYTTFNGHRKHNEESVADMERLFFKYKVNLVLSGHDHFYMRTYPIYQYRLHRHNNDSAPVYITVGTGGCKAGPPSIFGYKNKLISEYWVAARRLQDSGFGQIDFVNATHAYWEFRANNFTDDYGKSSLFADWKTTKYSHGKDWNGKLSYDKDGISSLRDAVWLYNPHKDD